MALVKIVGFQCDVFVRWENEEVRRKF